MKLSTAISTVWHRLRRGRGRSPLGAPPRDPAVESVIAEVILRRQAADPVSDESMCCQHPQLLPELKERLKVLRGIEAAQAKAGIEDAPGSDHGESNDDELCFLQDLLEGYELLERIEYGGQGAVYRARQLSTDRQVALKVLSGGAFAPPRHRLRFEREVELLARLRHPHIVTLHDRGIVGGAPYFVMELIDGHSIDDYALLHCPTAEEVVRLFVLVCRAVAAAHQRGIMHRDLKPGNILVDRDGEPHLLDFGLAKAVDDEPVGGGPTVSLTGQVVGTLPYLSPEQAAGDDAEVDTRTDVYSLGVILFQLITGEFPYPVGGSMGSVRDNILKREPARLREALKASTLYEETRLSSRHEDLEWIIRKALEKGKEDRYASAAALADDLDRFLAGEPVEARRHTGLYVLRKTVRRYRRSVIGAAVVVIALSALAGAGLRLAFQRDAAVATGDLQMDLERSFNRRILNLYQASRAEANRLADVRELPDDVVEAHLARYEQAPRGFVGVFEALPDGMPPALLRSMRGAVPADFEVGKQWLSRAEGVLDRLGNALVEGPVQFPVEAVGSFTLGQQNRPINRARETAEALVARAYMRLREGDHGGAVSDLSAARWIALDLADGVTYAHLSAALVIRYDACAFAQWALTRLAHESERLQVYLRWVRADPPLRPHRLAIPYEATAFTELVTAAFVVDPRRGSQRLDLDRLDEIFNGYLRSVNGLTPVHRRFASDFRPEDLPQLVSRYIEVYEVWDDLTYRQLRIALDARMTAYYAESRENPLVLMMNQPGLGYAAELRITALRRALRIAADLLVYRQEYGDWPHQPLEATLPDNTLDPMTGDSFCVDIHSDCPRIRSSELGDALGGPKAWIEPRLDAVWLASNDDRLTYFPAAGPKDGP